MRCIASYFLKIWTQFLVKELGITCSLAALTNDAFDVTVTACNLSPVPNIICCKINTITKLIHEILAKHVICPII